MLSGFLFGAQEMMIVRGWRCWETRLRVEVSWANGIQPVHRAHCLQKWNNQKHPKTCKVCTSLIFKRWWVGNTLVRKQMYYIYIYTYIYQEVLEMISVDSPHSLSLEFALQTRVRSTLHNRPISPKTAQENRQQSTRWQAYHLQLKSSHMMPTTSR